MKQLDWTSETITDEELMGIDVLFSADVWYDIEVRNAFVSLVKRIVDLNKCIFINATAIRNQLTYDAFKKGEDNTVCLQMCFFKTAS